MDFAARIALRNRIRAMVEPIARDVGCEVIAVEVSASRSNAVLRISVDREGGASIRDCAKITRTLNPELDAEDPVPVPYQLEVSSPGQERPLERPADFNRFAGFRVKLRGRNELGKRRWSGILRGIEDGAVLVEKPDALERVPLDQIERAHLDLTPEEFMRLGAARSNAEGVEP
jgi:ribosome maturation factor RimP